MRTRPESLAGVLMSDRHIDLHPTTMESNKNQDLEWSHLFAAPLNPTAFAALSANGVLGNPSAMHYPSPGPSSSWSQSAAARPYAGERSNPGLPPSLWMSTTTTQSPPLVRDPVHHSYSPISPTSPSTDSKSTLFTDIFSDDLFTPLGPPLSPQHTSPFTSPRLSGSPVLKASPDPDIDPDHLAKEDPLATQVWKMYARTKVSLPHAQRMENITWRMMALALKKKKEEEDASASADAHQPNPAHPDQPTPALSSLPSEEDQPPPPSDERGRRIDKGKAPVRVVGFDGLTQDGLDEQESVFPFLSPCLIFSFCFQGLFPWIGGQ
jgi:hypothetical protein